MLASLTSAQVGDWLAYMRIEGLPDSRNDYGIAQIMMGMVGAFGGGTKGQTVADYMPWMKKPMTEIAQNPSEQIMALLGRGKR